MSAMAEAKLEFFLQWLQANGVELRGCEIKYCDSTKGFGVFSFNETPDGVLLVVPLGLAITPMRVLQDPLFGPEFRAMFEEGEVDDRFLVMMFLLVERLRETSSWELYLDMLPTTFGSSLWFTDEEFVELKGTALHQATKLQRKQLLSVYEEKVKGLVKKLLNLEGEIESHISFEDFLWANSIFWTRALNIPLPRSYVFPEKELEEGLRNEKTVAHAAAFEELAETKDRKLYNDHADGSEDTEAAQVSVQGETVWVEGLVPGIDFCNHDLKAIATWEVDRTGSITGVPLSMFLLSAEQGPFGSRKEIRISYGNKGNEELLYLYGFVVDNNPDDYLMVHYPVEAIRVAPFPDTKLQLVEAQGGEMRCLLPRSLLDKGFFPATAPTDESNATSCDGLSNFSWRGQRTMPSYTNKLVFPEDFLAALRTIAMKEEQLSQISHLLEELVGSGETREPSETEVRAAVWEVCGDSGALQLLVDLLQNRLMDLEEGTGTEDFDTELLKKIRVSENPDEHTVLENGLRGVTGPGPIFVSRNKLSAVVYRRGQKQLVRLFLKEAEHALQLSLSEGI